MNPDCTPFNATRSRTELGPDRDWLAFGVITLLAAALFLLRLSAPPNLLDQDQERPAAYVLDVLKNGNWICQRDLAGNIASKPPLYTWLAALLSYATGRVNQFSLYLPGALGLLGSACLIFCLGREPFGRRAALFGTLTLMLCPAGLKQFGLARTDGVFAFMVTLAAVCAYHAWIRGRGWTWFWLTAAAATLTKGPLGLVLGALGLLASLWEARAGARLPLRGSHAVGVGLFALLTVGWLAAAVWHLGRPVIDRLFFRELMFHAVQGAHKNTPGTLFYLSPLYYLARAAPWSVLGYMALWRTARQPASSLDERRLERFLFCWFVGGLLLFSMASHQRGDLLWPILPAVALLAGRELVRLTRRFNRRALDRAATIGVTAGVAGFAVYYRGPHSGQPYVQQTVALKQLAQEIARRGGDNFPLTHTDDPTGLQVYLNTFRKPVSFERAAGLLRSPVAAYVAVSNWSALQALKKPDDPPVYTILEDSGSLAELHVRIVSNRPELRADTNMALALGPWTVRYTGRLQAANGDTVIVDATPEARVIVANQGGATSSIHLGLISNGVERRQARDLAPGQELDFGLNSPP